VLLSAQPAAAAMNTGPSSAVAVTPGIPFSGDWTGTPRQHIADCCDYWHFYRPTVTLRTGDALQLAIDNTQHADELYVCLLSPTDEFGANAMLRNECGDETTVQAIVQAGALARETVRYPRSTPGGFLVFEAFDSDPPTGQYTVTIERVITRVNIGLVPPRRLKRHFTLGAALRYGDNTPVVDGSTAVLQYRRGRKSSRGPRRQRPWPPTPPAPGRAGSARSRSSEAA